MGVNTLSTGQLPISILIADDDPDDRLLIKDALDSVRLANAADFVEDGEELLDFLLCRNDFQHRKNQPLPGLILLDLNMPRKDGREALQEIKADPALRRIPVVVLTTSKAEEDILRTYDLGVNSFIVKPVSFEQLLRTMTAISEYWLQIVQLPN